MRLKNKKTGKVITLKKKVYAKPKSKRNVA